MTSKRERVEKPTNKKQTKWNQKMRYKYGRSEIARLRLSTPVVRRDQDGGHCSESRAQRFSFFRRFSILLLSFASFALPRNKQVEQIRSTFPPSLNYAGGKRTNCASRLDQFARYPRLCQNSTVYTRACNSFFLCSSGHLGWLGFPKTGRFGPIGPETAQCQLPHRVSSRLVWFAQGTFACFGRREQNWTAVSPRWNVETLVRSKDDNLKRREKVETAELIRIQRDCCFFFFFFLKIWGKHRPGWKSVGQFLFSNARTPSEWGRVEMV